MRVEQAGERAGPRGAAVPQAGLQEGESAPERGRLMRKRREGHCRTRRTGTGMSSWNENANVIVIVIATQLGAESSSVLAVPRWKTTPTCEKEFSDKRGIAERWSGQIKELAIRMRKKNGGLLSPRTCARATLVRS